MPNFLTIDRTYADNDVLYQADLDAICDSIMTFENITKLNTDNLAPEITDFLLSPGLILLFTNETLPTTGWLPCDGTEVSQATYADLFAVLGTTYNTGGEGMGNFRLPDYARRVPVGMGGSGTAVLGNALGNSGGEEAHQLLTTEIASHAHGDSTGHAHFENAEPVVGGSLPRAISSHPGGGVVSASTAPDLTGITTPTFTNTGGDVAHNTVQPSLVMKFMVKT